MMVVSIFTVQAHATTQNGLKAAFDEMNYTLTVEWDQKDQSVYEAQLKKFTAVVRDLQKSGMTNAQMIDFAKSEIKDAKVAKDLETAFSMITINKMSSEEASKYMISSMKRAYSNGASWNGDAVIYLVAGLLIVALAVGLASGNTTVSVGTGCYDECYYYDYTCGYDIWGPYYCEAYACDTYCY
jgi:hypothetical protein